MSQRRQRNTKRRELGFIGNYEKNVCGGGLSKTGRKKNQSSVKNLPNSLVQVEIGTFPICLFLTDIDRHVGDSITQQHSPSHHQMYILASAPKCRPCSNIKNMISNNPNLDNQDFLPVCMRSFSRQDHPFLNDIGKVPHLIIVEEGMITDQIVGEKKICDHLNLQ